jgi:flagellin-like protein
MWKKMKMLKSRKALSPVVASIILIAVTVAVSIAVAAWMGALTFSFMGTEQVRISKMTWTWSDTASARTFTIYVNNTGTKDVTINQIQVNYGTTGVTQPTTLPLILKASTNAMMTVTYAYTNGTNYDISVVTTSNYKFTNNFAGGQNTG